MVGNYRPNQVGGESIHNCPSSTLSFDFGTWVGDRGFLRIVEIGGDRQSFAYPTYKRSELFKSEAILEGLSAHGASIEDL